MAMNMCQIQFFVVLHGLELRLTILSAPLSTRPLPQGCLLHLPFGLNTRCLLTQAISWLCQLPSSSLVHYQQSLPFLLWTTLAQLLKSRVLKMTSTLKNAFSFVYFYANGAIGEQAMQALSAPFAKLAWMVLVLHRYASLSDDAEFYDFHEVSSSAPARALTKERRRYRVTRLSERSYMYT